MNDVASMKPGKKTKKEPIIVTSLRTAFVEVAHKNICATPSKPIRITSCSVLEVPVVQSNT
jgi:hypothetical protein